MLSDTTFENGTWSVVDHQLGRPIGDRDGSAGRTRLEAQALADFRNGISASPPKGAEFLAASEDTQRLGTHWKAADAISGQRTLGDRRCSRNGQSFAGLYHGQARSVRSQGDLPTHKDEADGAVVALYRRLCPSLSRLDQYNLANQREGIGGQPSQASIAGGPGREETHLYQSLRKIGHGIAFNEVLTVVIVNKGLRSSPVRGRKIGEL
ncbi:hypothetical protein AF71_00013790 [Rhizobium sp. 57MFTsu3.2]|nr:hypothetical protein [Rhizobium sp. 57MFTsu3.2]